MDEVRASDAEREAVVSRLRSAAADGRLDAEELEQRVAAALAARTHADLSALTRDLPTVPAVRPESDKPALSEPLRRRLAGALTADVVCIAVWAATGANGSFWPIWVILGTGIGVVAELIHRAFGVEREPRAGRGADRRR